ncbi:FxLYD domain-containing protein [Pseudomonas arsenicoxydans]|uniref:Membrane-associated Zn-dependent protease 1 n=1 Tax=Pseudomonas arsenicoxydans TaxID=702115 RepID=A0A502GTZ2_9PSED|nr:FxLYD domain-containing protein [Pseudomonas arsenicoxydans]TPG65699.1 membrane-associated Zn-dependent protease 1 [Pseudomonas arsenicoxydans]
MRKKSLSCLAGVALAFGYSMSSSAAPELHLNFHMGGSSGGQSFVGGTLINSGDAPVAHGYVVVTLLDAQCHPLKSVLEHFANIPAGEKLGFRVPINGALKRYRLASVKGFDAEGFEVMAVDDNAELLKGREPADREYCAKAREAVVQRE